MNYLLIPSIVFIFVNFTISSSDFTFIHPISSYFLKNYYIAELVLKNNHNEKTLLQTLPRLAALNLSSKDGNLEVKYITSFIINFYRL